MYASSQYGFDELRAYSLFFIGTAADEQYNENILFLTTTNIK